LVVTTLYLLFLSSDPKLNSCTFYNCAKQHEGSTIFSNMDAGDLRARIEALEASLLEHEKMLDESIRRNESFGKSKIIFNKLNEISRELIGLKKGMRGWGIEDDGEDSKN